MPERWERMSADCFRLVRGHVSALITRRTADMRWVWLVERRNHKVDGVTVGYRLYASDVATAFGIAKLHALDELDAHAPKETE